MDSCEENELSYVFCLRFDCKVLDFAVGVVHESEHLLNQAMLSPIINSKITTTPFNLTHQIRQRHLDRRSTSEGGRQMEADESGWWWWGRLEQVSRLLNCQPKWAMQVVALLTEPQISVRVLHLSPV